MPVLWFVLGAVAKINATLWRYRINFVPINVVVIGIIAVFGFMAFDSAVEGLRNSRTTVRVTFLQIHDTVEIVQNYVTVTGLEIPVAVYEYGTKGSNGDIITVEKSWFPFLDRDSRRILLVQKPGKLSGGEPREASITGMLRAMDRDLHQRLASQQDTIEGLPVERRYVLVADERPGDSTNNTVLAVILFGLFGLFAIAALKRNTIFQPTGHIPTAGAASAEPTRIGATGTFALDQAGARIQKRFINMPAMLTQLEGGHTALFSNIDASNRFMGFTTSKRAGIWVLPIEAGSVHNYQTGFLYWGTSRLHALRFSYIDGLDRAKRQAIITTDKEAVLGSVIGRLAPTAG